MLLRFGKLRSFRRFQRFGKFEKLATFERFGRFGSFGVSGGLGVFEYLDSCDQHIRLMNVGFSVSRLGFCMSVSQAVQ